MSATAIGRVLDVIVTTCDNNRGTLRGKFVRSAMNQAIKSGIAYGVFDAGNGVMLACDENIKTWLAGRPLERMLPELDLQAELNDAGVRTRLCRAGEEPILVAVELRPLVSENHKWILLRIQIVPEHSTNGEYRDVVTGLPDRRALEHHRLKWQRDSSTQQVPHALLFMDLDNFKQINDSHGHVIGDQVLNILANRWQKSLRNCDLIVRYGGDEFVVLLAGIGAEREASPVIQRLKQATSEPILLDSHKLTLSATIGLAIASDTTATLKELVAIADKAMYAAKGTGS